MKHLRIVACDDESFALERLSDLLAYCPDAELVEAVTDPREVADALRRHQPDALILDVEMPKLSGFDVLDRLTTEDLGDEPYFPQVLLLTAHPEFAATAYDAGALDFLTKPLRLKRLELALERIRQTLMLHTAAERLTEVAAELEQLRGRQQADDAGQLWIRSHGETVRLDVDKIAWVEAEGLYVRLHTASGSYLHRESITSMASRLTEHGFTRVHRGAIVKISDIASFRRTPDQTLMIRLESGPELRVGRTYRHMVTQLLKT